MKITQVEVTVHEKRNNPFEFGHYDCSVTLAAELWHGDCFDDVVQNLRDRARLHVEDECNGWEHGIRLEKDAADTRACITNLLHGLFWVHSEAGVDEALANIHNEIQKLPWEDRDPLIYQAGEAALAARERIAHPDEESPPF